MLSKYAYLWYLNYCEPIRPILQGWSPGSFPPLVRWCCHYLGYYWTTAKSHKPWFSCHVSRGYWERCVSTRILYTNHNYCPSSHCCTFFTEPTSPSPAWLSSAIASRNRFRPPMTPRLPCKYAYMIPRLLWSCMPLYPTFTGRKFQLVPAAL